MTVIATDGITMAGDGLISLGHTVISDNAVKVHRFDDGRLIGASGASGEIASFVEWLRTGGDKPTIDEPFQGLEVRTDGSIVFYDGKLSPIPCAKPMAIGCGDDFAIGAMLAGASPLRAAEIACERSNDCGGTIRLVSRSSPVVFRSEYCLWCQRYCVRCPDCGMNTCSGGYGEVEGGDCPTCPEAYKVDGAS